MRTPSERWVNTSVVPANYRSDFLRLTGATGQVHTQIVHDRGREKWMDYQQAKREAPEHLAVLERHLDESSSTEQVDFPYEMVARAFPSCDPRAESFDYNFVEYGELMSWAKKKGWDVEQISREKVRFTKISK